MVLSGDEGKMMELGFLPAGDTQSKSVGLSMRKKTHNLLYTAISYWASPVKPPELHLLALNCFLLTPLLALQCWLSTVLLLIKKEGLLLKLHLIVMMIGRLRSISLTITVCKFFSLSVACLNLILGSPIPFATMTAGGSSTASHDSHLISNDDREIWSYIWNLQGVIGVLYQPMLTSFQSASLGVLADDYLLAHGYTLSAINVIVSTAKSSASVEEFVDVLTVHGFAQTEAKFLWDIIEHESEY